MLYADAHRALAFDALALWALGLPDQALSGAREALALARALAHPVSIGQAHCYTAMVHQLRHEPSDTREQARESIAVTRDGDFPQFLSYGNILHGWARGELDDALEGAVELREGLASAKAMENLEAQLAGVGAELSDIAKTLCFLTDMDTFATFNDAYVAGLGDHRPARSTIGVAALPAGAAVLGTSVLVAPFVVVLLLLPVLVCMGSAAIAVVLGVVLNNDAEVRHEGSELLDLNV